MMFHGTRNEEATDLQESHAAKRGKVQHSIIGKGLKITGDLHSAGDITVHGTVEGSITCRSLTLGDTPTVSSITAESVRISGEFQGDIRAKQVVLGSQAKVSGDIWHESLQVEAGASIEGRLGKLNAKAGKKAPKVAAVEPAEAAAG